MPVTAQGDVPAPGTPVLAAGIEVGTMRSGQGDRGLALLRLDAFGTPLTCGGIRLVAAPPSWMAVSPAGVPP